MYAIINVGDTMRIAIDKNSISALDKKNDFIYLFKDEPLDELIKLNLHCVKYDSCNFVDINLTEYEVDCFKQAKPSDKDCKVLPEKINYKIGIIIPNFNYAECLERCFNSLLNQTYKNFEIVFIDDCSTDNSVEIAKKLLKPPHKVIQLKQKRLNGGARNEAYLHLSDDVDYVYYVDSDDWICDKEALEHINNKLQTRPDVLFVGMSQYKHDKLSVCFIPRYQDKYEAFKGWSGSCGKVIKKSLATRQECLYNEGTLKEDRNQHCKICFYMKSFALLQEPIYVWNQMNSKSVTTIRDKVVWGTSTIRHYADTLQFALSIKGQDAKIDKIMDDRVRQTKQEMESGGDKQW